MNDLDTLDWAESTATQQLAAARRGTPDQLCGLARRYDWRLFPEPVLGWIMAQKAIDLDSALTAFFNGEPERFNYIPKRDVPEKFADAARVLDNICLRVNSGFYLAHEGCGMLDNKRLKNWLLYQEADRAEGRRGRWILDERIIRTLREDRPAPAPAAAPLPDKSVSGLLRDILSPIAALGVSREHLKYLPTQD